MTTLGFPIPELSDDNTELMMPQPAIETGVEGDDDHVFKDLYFYNQRDAHRYFDSNLNVHCCNILVVIFINF